MFENKTIIIFTILILVPALAISSMTMAAATATAATAATAAATTTEYRVYDNSTLGIKIEVPFDWLYKEINNTVVNFVTEKPLPQNASTIYRAVVSVSVQENIPKNMSLAVFTQENIKDLEQATPSFHLITSNSTTLAGNPARQIVFTSQPSTAKELRKSMITSTLTNSKAYIITYVAGPGVDKFPLQLPVVKHMIDSFQITK